MTVTVTAIAATFTCIPIAIQSRMFESVYRALTLLADITLPTPPSPLSVTPSLPPFHSLSTCPFLILQNTRPPVFHLPPPVNSSPSPYSSPLLAPITPLLPLFSPPQWVCGPGGDPHHQQGEGAARHVQSPLRTHHQCFRHRQQTGGPAESQGRH